MGEIDPRQDPLYLIADVATADGLGVDLVQAVRGYLSGGGRMVSLRAQGISDGRALRLGREIAAMVASVGGLFLVHRRADLAVILAADGVHLPSDGLTPREVREVAGHSLVLGQSAHRPKEVPGPPVAFATLGPFFESLSKPGYGPALSLSALTDLPVTTPVYALGGVTPENARHCVEAGAFGIAVVGGILGAPDPATATASYFRALAGLPKLNGASR